MAEPERIDELQDTLAYVAITRLQGDYGDAVSRRAWDEVAAMFGPDCPLRLDVRSAVIERTGGPAIATFIAESIERFEFFAFTIVNTSVQVAADGCSATGRLSMRELRFGRDDKRWTTAYGLYRDEYHKLDGRWRFAARDYATLARDRADGAGMEVFPIPGR